MKIDLMKQRYSELVSKQRRLKMLKLRDCYFLKRNNILYLDEEIEKSIRDIDGKLKVINSEIERMNEDFEIINNLANQAIYGG